MMSNFIKYTHGFMVQRFDSDGNFIGQDFIAGDDVEWEDAEGQPVETQDFYHPFNEV
jgi:hypothetical protein